MQVARTDTGSLMVWNRKLKQLVGSATRAVQQALRAQAARQTDASPASTAAMPTGFPFHSIAHWPAQRAAQAEDAATAEANQGTPATPPAELPGSFTRVAFTQAGAHHPQARHYHLYVPPAAATGGSRPLLLMLHGCTQNPADFATGTGMNEAAARANALVLYPEQTHHANRHACWNWFRPEDQRRDRGEPGLLMAMVQDVMARHRVDASRIYVAGLSAGGAMAALLAREYPDVFAAAGVHSGLPAGAAHSMMTALSAMKHGAPPAARGQPVAPPGQRVVPVIVFHGDADEAVHARNGDQLVAATLGSLVGGASVLDQVVEQGTSPAGQPYTRTVYRRALISGGRVMAEHWVLHGGGHAWSGGSAQGSYTDPGGISATDEMLRFFLSHRR